MEPDLTLEEAAKVLRRNPVWLRTMAREGKVPGAYKFGGLWMIRRECLREIRGLGPGDGEE